MSNLVPDSEDITFCLDPCVKYIVEGSKRLKCSTATRTKALLIYHHFKRLYGIEYDHIIAATCLSLAIKFYGDNIENDEVIFAFYSIIGQPLSSTKDKRLNIMKRSLADMEIIILRMSEFCLNHHLAHEYLVFYLNDMCELMTKLNIWDIVAELSMKLACDFYLSDKCLEYKPDEIALAVLQSALYLIGIKATPDSYITSWLKALNNVPESKLFDIITDISMVCCVGPIANRTEEAQDF